MKTLLISGPFSPKPGNNVIILRKLLSSLSQASDLHFLSFFGPPKSTVLPDSYDGIPIRWCIDNRKDFRRKVLYPLSSAMIDRNGFSDALTSRLLLDEAKTMQKETSFSTVISTMEPFPAANAAGKLKHVKKILYLMDPPACIFSGKTMPYRDRRLKKILAAQDAIITTPFIQQALKEHGFRAYDLKILPVGFPLIEKNNYIALRHDDGRIHLLFCGWLYSEIRSPKFFLDIVSRLDERFVVTFMGKECTKLRKRFDVKTKAELITMPQQPYETALQAMADADIMINIGNSVPVHMPSKTLEYINTGKPFVNFYKINDCPTLYYTKRYPLCLNLSEKDPDLDTAAARFTEFCENSKGRTVDRQYIEREYADCTPEFIAGQLLRALEKT